MTRQEARRHSRRFRSYFFVLQIYSMFFVPIRVGKNRKEYRKCILCLLRKHTEKERQLLYVEFRDTIPPRILEMQGSLTLISCL